MEQIIEKRIFEVAIKAIAGVKAIEFEQEGHKFIHYVQVNGVSQRMNIPAEASFKIIPDDTGGPVDIQITARSLGSVKIINHGAATT